MIFLVACTGAGPSKNQADTNTGKSPAQVKAPPAKSSKVIGADENSLVTEIQRKDVLLFGKTIAVMPAELQQEMSQAVIEMNLVMSNARIAAVGPLTLAYTAMPAAGLKKIFVGQPVKKRFTATDGFGFLTIPAGVYFKMTCNAEPTGTLEYHLKMQTLLNQNSHSFGTPALEIFSESRNNEMTVVSKATLLYPKK